MGLERMVSPLSEPLLMWSTASGLSGLSLLPADRNNMFREAVEWRSQLLPQSSWKAIMEVVVTDNGINCISKSTPGLVCDLMPARHTQNKWTQGLYLQSLRPLMLPEPSLSWEGREALRKRHFWVKKSELGERISVQRGELWSCAFLCYKEHILGWCIFGLHFYTVRRGHLGRNVFKTRICPHGNTKLTAHEKPRLMQT